MKRQAVAIHRFIHNGEDISFVFYGDHTIVIKDNNSNEYLLPADLSTEAYVFYAFKRISYIKNHVLKVKENKNEGAVTV